MNLWKAFALIMIGLLIFAVGIRFAYVETHLFTLNQEQKTFSINAAMNGLRDELGNNDYNVTVQDHGWVISTKNGDKKVARVVLTRGNVILTALVDMDAGDIVEKSRVEHTGWMTEYQDQNPRRWGHQRLFNR